MTAARKVEALVCRALCACLAFAAALLLWSCSLPPFGKASSDSSESWLSSVCDVINARPTSASSDATGQGFSQQVGASISYPTAWLIVDVDGIPAGTALQLLSAPGLSIEGHRNGVAISLVEQEREMASWAISPDEEIALVEYHGMLAAVDPSLLLMNLPDVMPDAVYDIVYSYAATSNCAGNAIPGVTGERIPGYAEGMRESAYWGASRYVVPCAYRTALKLRAASSVLQESGYRLLVYDAYRPMTAQRYLSDAFAAAYEENLAIREGVGDWSLAWYVASGPSGHNYGTDVDVGVCDLDGNSLPMPSSFDAFDESGHLTWSPMDSAAISVDSYRDAVLQNDACMALHQAFASAGFAELASEWWHFGDPETEASSRNMIGDEGLDFEV